MKLLVAVVLFAAGCGAKSPGPAAPTQAEPTASVALPDLPFDKLDHDQRIEFMKQKVIPAMKPVFQRHDPKGFADFGCQTCHGPEAKDGHFDMPNPRLPKLNFGDMSKFSKEDIEWMGKEVLPTMAQVLGEPVHSKENPKGFGCLHCHTQEGG